ncbi:MAG: phosphatidylserine decarboxylase family protein [Crocinitomicaceae bacterium]|nr:phosphatidylserine decarboxylase family protein [Crocinitomicaceae bacterium]
MKLHREGFSILFSLFIASLGILGLLSILEVLNLVMWIVGGALLILFFLFAQFFRVPKRSINEVEGEVMCPSDGKVVVIEKVFEPEYFKDDRIQVSIFMSPLNVHVQWTPIAGLVKYAVYHAGKYLVAWHPKSSTKNERTTLVVESSKGDVLFRQIAGAVARRIRYYVKPGDLIMAGEEVGFIKFGSRIDVFLPLDADIHVKLEEKVKGRETLLATLKGIS